QKRWMILKIKSIKSTERRSMTESDNINELQAYHYGVHIRHADFGMDRGTIRVLQSAWTVFD
ncbi:MAG: hypothetical protein LBI74_05610, partial [Synergistaceae bacterium]|nr:hypothetical protein [Synergistaceae bacterium]